MRDKSIGSSAPTSRCSLCGNTFDMQSLQLECVTETTWKTTDDKSFVENCDPRVWLVALCRACRVENYRVSLKKMVGIYKGLIIGCIFFIIFGGLIVWSGLSSRPGKDDWMFVLLGLVGVIGLPLSIWFYIVNKVRLSQSENLQEIPARLQKQTFTSAGETILERLEAGRAETVYGDFPLSALPENPVPRDIPEKFKQATLSPKQKRLVRWLEGTQ